VWGGQSRSPVEGPDRARSARRRFLPLQLRPLPARAWFCRWWPHRQRTDAREVVAGGASTAAGCAAAAARRAYPLLRWISLMGRRPGAGGSGGKDNPNRGKPPMKEPLAPVKAECRIAPTDLAVSGGPFRLFTLSVSEAHAMDALPGSVQDALRSGPCSNILDGSLTSSEWSCRRP